MKRVPFLKSVPLFGKNAGSTKRQSKLYDVFDLLDELVTCFDAHKESLFSKNRIKVFNSEKEIFEKTKVSSQSWSSEVKQEVSSYTQSVKDKFKGTQKRVGLFDYFLTDILEENFSLKRKEHTLILAGELEGVFAEVQLRSNLISIQTTFLKSWFRGLQINAVDRKDIQDILQRIFETSVASLEENENKKLSLLQDNAISYIIDLFEVSSPLSAQKLRDKRSEYQLVA